MYSEALGHGPSFGAGSLCQMKRPSDYPERDKHHSSVSQSGLTKNEDISRQQC